MPGPNAGQSRNKRAIKWANHGLSQDLGRDKGRDFHSLGTCASSLQWLFDKIPGDMCFQFPMIICQDSDETVRPGLPRSLTFHPLPKIQKDIFVYLASIAPISLSSSLDALCYVVTKWTRLVLISSLIRMWKRCSAKVGWKPWMFGEWRYQLSHAHKYVCRNYW